MSKNRNARFVKVALIVGHTKFEDAELLKHTIDLLGLDTVPTEATKALVKAVPAGETKTFNMDREATKKLEEQLTKVSSRSRATIALASHLRRGVSKAIRLANAAVARKEAHVGVWIEIESV